MADNKKAVGFKIAIEGISNEATELAKLEIHLKNIKKEKQELMKLAGKGIASNEEVRQLAAYNKEIAVQEAALKTLKRVVDTANDSLARKKALLIQLTSESDKATKAVRDGMAPAIKKLNDEIKNGEQARGVFTRNVGNYGEAVKTSFISMGESMLRTVGPVAIITTAMSKLKDAFLDTEQGARFVTQTTNAVKTFFQGIISGFSIGTSAQLAGMAADIGKEWDVLRIKQRDTNLEIARLENDVRVARFASVDAMKSQAEQLEYLNIAQDAEDKIINLKKADLEEEMSIMIRLASLRQNDTKLLDDYNNKLIEYEQLEGERSFRLESRKSKILVSQREKETKAAQDKLNEQQSIDNLMEDENIKMGERKEKREEKFEQDRLDRLIKIEQQIIRTKEKAADEQLAIDNLMEDENIAMGERMLKREERDAAAKIKQQEEIAEQILTLENTLYDALADVAFKLENTIFNTKKEKLEAKKEMELAAEGLTVEEKHKINLKYVKEHAKLALAQIWMDGGIATLNALATSTSWKEFLKKGIQISGVVTAAIADVHYQVDHYAEGGKIREGVKINTGKKDNMLILANQTETVLTEQQVARLGGSATMKRIRVPGYAEGGFIGQSAPDIPASGFDFNQLARLMNNMQIVLDTNKVRSSLNELEVINASQRI